MSKIRVLSDQLANQIAAGEVVERPASVAKELVENAIDAGARRLTVDVEAGGRRLLRVVDDGEGMTRDDAVLAFERHATSKISNASDLDAIATLGFRGEALASIASVARVELVTKTENAAAATRVLIEGGRMRDVKDAAHPKGTTITVRDLFFNVPARRKFLRSEATESFHLTNLVTHYALAHPEIAFTLTNNGRETLRATPAADLRERAYQIFGAEFLENLLEVGGGQMQVASVRGYVSAPRERRTSRDAQYLFVNGRYVRDRLIGRALSDGYRSILPHGVYPAALLFLEVPLEEVDVNVHPAKTEVRFRRAAAVADSVREAVRAALASAGYTRPVEAVYETVSPAREVGDKEASTFESVERASQLKTASDAETDSFSGSHISEVTLEIVPPSRQGSIEFGFTPTEDEGLEEWKQPSSSKVDTARGPDAILRPSQSTSHEAGTDADDAGTLLSFKQEAANGSGPVTGDEKQAHAHAVSENVFPPLVSAANLVREVPLESVSTNIRPLGQLEESYIIATDDEGLLLIDQHVAHERILFDKYRALEGERTAESQNLLMPETFDLTPAQAAAFDTVAPELETYGFGLMRLSGRTVAIKAVPADLPAGEARNMLAEVLETVDAEKRGAVRATLRDEIAASLACRAAIKVNTPLATEKMRWLIDRLLLTSSPTTCPHGRPVILRLTTRDIEKSFHRS
ncbi:MAG TPA: DNA mismatch repair endonuclease MutL [Pyrinomonadaceae bacterium]|nr:DNA mismatch repair endonuclease MutL [Pyrinomonadaceae bacterium]